MKTILLAALTALPLLGQAQQPTDFVPFPDNGVYMTASDFTHHVLTNAFNTGQPGYRLHDEPGRHAVKITEPATAETEIPDSRLWGERIHDVDYRVVDGELYRVEHADRIFVYSKASTINMLTQPIYYFSRDSDSPVYAITSENLANVYYDQPNRKERFTPIDDLSDHSVQQAVALTKLFYTGDLHGPTASPAD